MQRKRIAVAAVAVAAVGAAVAFTLPSMAGTTPRGTSPRAAAGTSPQLLAALKRDLGVDGDQAQARLDRARWASRVSANLAVQTGSDFGGAWLAEDGMTLKVAVTDGDAAAKVASAGGQAVMVKRSEQQLDEAKEKLDEAADAADDLAGWFVSPQTNKVVIQALPGNTDAAWDFAEEAGLDRGDVAVQTAKQAKPLADIAGGDAAIIDGEARCTVGFAVVGGFVWAGHCGQRGAEISDFVNGQLGDDAGQIAASVFPGSADMGFVKTDANDTLQPVVQTEDGPVDVLGSQEAPVGAPICRTGSTTGTFCGTVLAKNQTVEYPEGTVTGLTATDVCAEGGDSGGPWLTGNQAQGVTSGGSGDCTVGGTTFFQPVNEILQVNRLTLLTADAQGGGDQQADASAPPADQGAADDQAAAACPEMSVQMQGALNKSGVGQSLPTNGAFRSRSGEQAACLQGPDGSDFDLVLQKRSLRGFRTVAQATGDGAVKQLTFNGRAGTYRYVVVASSGTGDFTLNLNTP